MSESQQSDILKDLVKFLIYLAIVGIVIALVLYFMGVIPVQQLALHAPRNCQWSQCY
jgi:hypothetical protein